MRKHYEKEREPLWSAFVVGRNWIGLFSFTSWKRGGDGVAICENCDAIIHAGRYAVLTYNTELLSPS